VVAGAAGGDTPYESELTQMVYKPRDKTAWYLKLPTRTGWRSVSTGTKDKPTARAMQRMVDELGPQGTRAWDLLDAVHDHRLTLRALYDFWAMNDLAGARAALTETDLARQVTPWQAWLAGQVTAPTRHQYLAQLRTLIPEGRPFLRSHATPEAVSGWLHALPVGNATKRRYYAAAQSFFTYCRKVGALERSPLRDFSPPKGSKPRVSYLTQLDMQRVVDAEVAPWRGYFAVLYGTGLEVSVGLGLRRRDVDLGRREIFAAGTKTHCRERTVRVSEWAWPYVQALCTGKLPEAPLFPGLKRGAVGYHHRQVCARLEITDHQLRDSRHSWAVRAAKAGTPAEIIARQLGHADAVMVLKVYGRFMPSQHDRDKWEAIAALQDQEQAQGQGNGPALVP
jgi:integrase